MDPRARQSPKIHYSNPSLRPDSTDQHVLSPISVAFDTQSQDWFSSGNTPRSSRKSPLRFNESYVVMEEDSEVLAGLYTQRIDACGQIMDQLDVSIRRHEGLLTYVKTLQVHLEQNSKIAQADLKNRYTTAMNSLSALYDDYTSQMTLTIKEKEAILYEKASELDNFITHLTEIRDNLHFRLTAEPKATFVQKFREHINEAKLALTQWASDIDISSEFLSIPTPHFHIRSSFSESSEPPIDVRVQTDPTPVPFHEREPSLDSLQSNLLLDFQQLEQKRKEILERSMPLLDLIDEEHSPGHRNAATASKKPSKGSSSKRHKTRVYHNETSDEVQRLPIDVRSEIGPGGRLS